MTDKEVVSPVMNGGAGIYSYSKNSNFQRENINTAKERMTEAIAEKLNIEVLSSSLSTTFRVADLGCSTGPNTFFAVQNIIDAVKLKFQTVRLRESGNFSMPEFQIFFNDQTANDFNALFASLPPERPYFAAGVPGSFHGRLFPSSSLHLVHSSYAIHILSGVPKEVTDRDSPAWNIGKTHYSNSPNSVIRAYQAQYAKDMKRFLEARAEEIVKGGLMAIVIPGPPNETPHSEALTNKVFELLGFCLMDMVNEGKVSIEKVDSFNLPLYFAYPHEIETLVKLNGNFTIEMMESLPQAKPQLNALSSHMRAALEGIVKNHFGDEIIEELFDLIQKRAEKYAHSIYESGNAINFFILLKRVRKEQGKKELRDE